MKGIGMQRTHKITRRLLSGLLAMLLIIGALPCEMLSAGVAQYCSNLNFNLPVPTAGQPLANDAQFELVEAKSTQGNQAKVVSWHWETEDGTVVAKGSPADYGKVYVMKAEISGDQHMISSQYFYGVRINNVNINISECCTFGSYNTVTVTYAFPATSSRKRVNEFNVLVQEPAQVPFGQKVKIRDILNNITIDEDGADLVSIITTDSHFYIGDVLCDEGDDIDKFNSVVYTLSMCCYVKDTQKSYFDADTVVKINGKTADTTDVKDLVQSTTETGYYIYFSYTFIPSNYCYVSFDLNGHGTEVHEQGVPSDGKVREPEQPTEPGWAFTGWYTAADCKTPFVFQQDIITQDTILYAGWTKCKYNITYDLSGGTSPSERIFENTTVEFESQIPDLNSDATNALEKQGYSFDKWVQVTLNADGTVKEVYDGCVLTKMPACNLVYRAVFTPVTYSIAYDKGEGHSEAVFYAAEDTNFSTPLSAAQIEESYTDYTIESDTFTLPVLKGADQDRFLGWFIGESEDPITQIEKGDADLIPAEGTTLNLTAHWGLNEFSLTWKANGGKIGEGDYTGKENANVLYGTPITAPEMSLAHNVQTGWSVVSGSGPAQTVPVDLTGTDFATMPAADTEFTALWDTIQYSFVYDLGGGAWKKMSEIEPDHHNIVFLPNKQNETVAGTDFFVINNLQRFPDLSYRKTEIKPGSDNYHFEGWYYLPRREFEGEPQIDDYEVYTDYLTDKAIYDNNGWDESAKLESVDQSVVEAILKRVSGPAITIYARFEINTPKLTWDFAGGTASDDYSPKPASQGQILTPEAGSPVVLPTEVTKNGYNHTGYAFYLESSDDPMTEDEIAANLNPQKENGKIIKISMPNHALRIVAVFEPVSYTVQYVIGQNSCASWKSELAKPWDVSVGKDSYTIESATFNLRIPEEDMDITDGYEFVGWYDGTDPNDKDALLAMDPATTEDETYEQLNANFTKVERVTKNSTGDRILIGVWRRKAYDVVWNLNGAILSKGGDDVLFNPAFAFDDKSVYRTSARFKDTISAPDIDGKREGYTFKGWYAETGVASDDGSVTESRIPDVFNSRVFSMTMPASVITVYAVWELKTYNIEYVIDYNNQQIGYFDPEPQTTYTYESSFTLPSPKPYSRKYTFGGWYTEQADNPLELGADWNEGKKMTSIALHSSGALKLYARWIVNTEDFEMIFNRGTTVGDADYTRNGTYEYGYSLVFPVLEKKGYTFDGWKITATSDGTTLDPEEVSPADVSSRYPTLTKSLKCEAIFTPIEYHITYHRDTDPDGMLIGDFPSSATVLYRYTIEDPKGDYTFPAHVASDRPDMVFLGWYKGGRPDNPDVSQGEDWNMYSANKVEKIVAGSTIGDLDLWAVWIESEKFAKELEYEIKMIRERIAALEAQLVDGKVVLTSAFEQKLEFAYREYASSMNKTKLNASVPEVARMLDYYDEFHYMAGQKAELTAAAIRAIGTVNYDELSEGRINKARKAYDESLAINAVKKELAKMMPTAEQTLVDAEQTYAALGAKDAKDKKAASEALALLQALPDSVSLTPADKASIDKAVGAYEALSEDQKKLLPSSAVDRMKNAVSSYDSLAKEYTNNKNMAQAAATKLSLVPSNMTLSDLDKALVDDARATYEKLTPTQKAMISADLLKRLENAEKSYADQKEAKETAEYKAAYKKWDAKNVSEMEITKKIQKTKTDVKNVKGARYVTLRLTATGGKGEIKLKWKKVKKASGYLVYGCEYGKKMKLLETVRGKKKRTWAHENLSGDTYYKYIVVAYSDVKKFDTKKVLAVSETVYAAPASQTLANPRRIETEQKVASLVAAPGDKLSVAAQVEMNLKDAKSLVDVRYESSNKKVATVDGQGNVICKKPGKAVIYAIAQNGMSRSLKVLVKKDNG